MYFAVKYNVYLMYSLRYFEPSQIYFFWDADNSVSLKSESMLKFDNILKFNIMLLSQFKCLMKKIFGKLKLCSGICFCTC